MKICFNLFLQFITSLLLVSVNVSILNFSELNFVAGVNSAINSSLSCNSKPDGTKVADSKIKNDSGIIHSKNAIKKIWDEDGSLNVTAELIDSKQEVKITVYNMLGKEIRKMYNGLPQNKNDEGYYVFSSQLNLPKNIYFLVIQGATFKIANKFIVAK